MAVPAVLPREAAYWAGGALIAPPPEVHGDHHEAACNIASCGHCSWCCSMRPPSAFLIRTSTCRMS